METRQIIYNASLVGKFRKILLFMVRVPLPLLVIILALHFFIRRFLPGLIMDSDILVYPLAVIVGAAVLFTPFLFYVLIKEERRAWIVTFLVMIVLPYLFAFLIFYTDILQVPLMIVLMVPFYIYCYLLKRTVDEWLSEYEAHELRKEQKLEKARRLKEEEGWM